MPPIVRDSSSVEVDQDRGDVCQAPAAEARERVLLWAASSAAVIASAEQRAAGEPRPWAVADLVEGSGVLPGDTSRGRAVLWRSRCHRPPTPSAPPPRLRPSPPAVAPRSLPTSTRSGTAATADDPPRDEQPSAASTYAAHQVSTRADTAPRVSRRSTRGNPANTPAANSFKLLPNTGQPIVIHARQPRIITKRLQATHHNDLTKYCWLRATT